MTVCPAVVDAVHHAKPNVTEHVAVRAMTDVLEDAMAVATGAPVVVDHVPTTVRVVAVEGAMEHVRVPAKGHVIQHAKISVQINAPAAVTHAQQAAQHVLVHAAVSAITDVQVRPLLRIIRTSVKTLKSVPSCWLVNSMMSLLLLIKRCRAEANLLLLRM